MAGRGEEKGSGILEIIGACVAVCVVMIALIWLMAQQKVVWYSLPLLRLLAETYDLLPLPGFDVRYAELTGTLAAYARKPAGVNFFHYVSTVNTLMLPTVFIFIPLIAGCCTYSFLGAKASFYRRFKGDDLMEDLVKVFSGIAPVIKIGDDLIQNKNPKWSKQTSPEDFLKKARVNGRPIIVDGEISPDLARMYLTGMDVKEDAVFREGKRLVVSTTLGRQIVDMRVDAARAKKTCFADRLSPEGKAIFCILAPFAFIIGKEGKAISARARDALNWSAYGSRDGVANLSVAQPYFDKLRTIPQAQALFRVYHWEYTFLFELFLRAKRQGKITTGDFRWLKPTNRVMYYTLNNVGRDVAHSESAAAFNQHAFETKAFRLNRLPMLRDKEGKLVPVIFVECVIDGLLREYEWLKKAKDDESEDGWLQDESLWVKPQAAILTVKAPPPPPAHLELGPETAFDKQMKDESEKAADDFDNWIKSGVGNELTRLS